VTRFNEAARERRARGDARNLFQYLPPLQVKFVNENSKICIPARAVHDAVHRLGEVTCPPEPYQAGFWYPAHFRR